MTAREQMVSRIKSLSTEQIMAAVVAIGASDDVYQVVVRVNLLNEFERREGGDAVDMLMDRVGL
jgi:hypothetical protein